MQLAEREAKRPAQEQVRAQETEQLWEQWARDRDQATRNRLAAIYFPLARNMARMMSRSLAGRAELADLESFAAEALLSAIERYEPSMGPDFAAYAAYRIRYAILDGVRNSDWVPRSVRDRERKLRTLEEETYSLSARRPTETEEAEHLGLSVRDLRRQQHVSERSNVSSMNAHLDHAEHHDRSEPVAEDPTPLDAVLSKEMLEAIREGLEHLSARERTVISMSIGEEHTLAEIGRVLGVTESRACQIRTSGIRNLRSYLQSRGLMSA